MTGVQTCALPIRGDDPPRSDYGGPPARGDDPPRSDYGGPPARGDDPPRSDYGGPPARGDDPPPGDYGGRSTPYPAPGGYSRGTGSYKESADDSFSGCARRYEIT